MSCHHVAVACSFKAPYLATHSSSCGHFFLPFLRLTLGATCPQIQLVQPSPGAIPFSRASTCLYHSPASFLRPHCSAGLSPGGHLSSPFVGSRGQLIPRGRCLRQQTQPFPGWPISGLGQLCKGWASWEPPRWFERHSQGHTLCSKRCPALRCLPSQPRSWSQPPALTPGHTSLCPRQSQSPFHDLTGPMGYLHMSVPCTVGTRTVGDQPPRSAFGLRS